MFDMYDLIAIKSSDGARQRAIIDEFTIRCLDSDVDLLDIVRRDRVIDLAGEAAERLVRYCLLAVYAADIASVPYAEGRARHIERLMEVVDENGLSYDKVIYLTKYSEDILRELEKVCASPQDSRLP